MESLSELNHIAHTVIGTISFIGGIIALSTKKGSKIHKTGGRVFFIGMLYSAISIIPFIIEEFLPLAVLMSVATVYFIITSLSALHHDKKRSKGVDMIFIIFPFLLMVFTSIQFVRAFTIQKFPYLEY